MLNNEYCVPLNELLKQIAGNMSMAELSKSVVLMELSETIAKKRKEMRMSQTAFAEHMGVSQGMVSKWESGDYNFTINTLSDIATKLNLHFINPLSDTMCEDEYDQKYTFDHALHPVIKFCYTPNDVSKISHLEGVGVAS
ncbi:helix-turn-helix domain-containing protein [Faecalispora anaeroviscerum]|uniref:helix-turn-helix domain-containing protein n=1 Tax=Faecalispora anaeroviscerum TaxID=2991836 RepID=UPI0024BAE576|nr:helix-turn-helix transcriptional regulator [Faecalispora anaeroviscerum]